MPVADAISLLALTAGGERPPGTALRPATVHPCGLRATPVAIDARDLDALTGEGYAQTHFDRYLLILPRAPARQAETVERFFSWLADSYEQVVDRPRNVENIEALQSALLEAGGGAGPILDFGCGTGLSRLSTVVPADRTVAFDVSGAMRRHASRAGLEVLTPERLDALEPGSITGVFASYVLHLSTEAKYLLRCVAAMGDRPLLAANFHKGAGRRWTDALLAEHGLVPQALPSHPDRHGPAILYRRA